MLICKRALLITEKRNPGNLLLSGRSRPSDARSGVKSALRRERNRRHTLSDVITARAGAHYTSTVRCNKEARAPPHLRLSAGRTRFSAEIPDFGRWVGSKRSFKQHASASSRAHLISFHAERIAAPLPTSPKSNHANAMRVSASTAICLFIVTLFALLKGKFLLLHVLQVINLFTLV